ncbi:MAG TPA: hypothetical protein VFL90_18110 [Methylomirabilota bacterium]|nr:hypothetical protein [Methylomirabilota bacterium]
MRLRILLVHVLVVALLALTPLAQASPPDPTWLAGLYDDADYDDVVLLITGGASVVETALLDSLAVRAPVVDVLAPPEVGAPPSPVRSLDHSRAPPAR